MGLIIEKAREQAHKRLQTLLGAMEEIKLSDLYWNLAMNTGLTKKQIGDILDIWVEGGKCYVEQREEGMYVVRGRR
jgi:hypothetical protein